LGVPFSILEPGLDFSEADAHAPVFQDHIKFRLDTPAKKKMVSTTGLVVL
jgi:hypothetical protein